MGGLLHALPLPTRGSTSTRPSPPVSSPYTRLAAGTASKTLLCCPRPSGQREDAWSPHRAHRAEALGAPRLREPGLPGGCGPGFAHRYAEWGGGWVHPEVHRIRMPALPSPAGCPWGSYFFFLGISFLICEKGMIIVTSSAGWLGGAGRRTADLALTPPSPPFPVFSPPLPCACTQAHPLNPHPALARTVLCPPLKRLSTPLPRRAGFKQALPRRGILAPSPGG